MKIKLGQKAHTFPKKKIVKWCFLMLIINVLAFKYKQSVL